MKYCKFKNKIYVVENITNNTARISGNGFVVKTNIQNIELMPDNYIPKTTSKTHLKITTENVQNEIMLRHMLKEEAILALDKYIDQALVANLGRIRIIHGRHGGVLRTAVHEYLKTHPAVKEFHIADYHEGGIGVTIATIGKLKKD